MSKKAQQTIEKDTISFTSLFDMFNRRNIAVTLFVLLLSLLLGLLYIYFQTPVYQSHVSLEVDLGNQQRGLPDANDLLASIQQPAAAAIETEMDVLKSDFLLSKVIDETYDNVKIYNETQHPKTEYYKERPIHIHHVHVKNPQFYNQKFIIQPMDDQRFHIELAHSLTGKIKHLIGLPDTYSFSGTFRYGKKVETKDFSFIVANLHAKPSETYAFVIKYKPDQIEEIRKKMNIKPASLRSTVIEVIYQDVHPRRLKDFLTFLSKAYIHQNMEKKSEEASATLYFLNQKLGEIRKEFKKSADKLKRYKEHNDIIDIDTKTREVVDRIINLETEYGEVELDYKSFSILKKELDKGNYSAIGGYSDRYPVLANIINNLQTLEAQKTGLQEQLTDLHPDIKSITNQIHKVKQSLKNVTKGIEDILRKRKNELHRMIAKQKAKIQVLPEKEQDLVNLERINSINERLYYYLLQKQSELSLVKSAKSSDVRILDYPDLPLTPVKPNKKIVLMTSLFFGLVLSMLLAHFRRDYKIYSVKDVERYSHIPVFGEIPYIQNEKLYNSVYVLTDPRSVASEAFRRIRVNLEYTVTPQQSKVVMVTSSVPNEGKTVVAANLAAVIGMSEKRTILLSLDMRRPEMHHKFKLSNKIGISDVLAGKAELEDVIWQHEIYPNLNIITSGRIPPNPAELLASEHMQEVLTQLRKDYDYIILDTPPVNYAADAMVLLKYVDITLFVVKSGFTEQKYLTELDEMVEKLKIERCGIVLNSVKNKYASRKNFDKKYIYYEPV